MNFIRFAIVTVLNTACRSYGLACIWFLLLYFHKIHSPFLLFRVPTCKFGSSLFLTLLVCLISFSFVLFPLLLFTCVFHFYFNFDIPFVYMYNCIYVACVAAFRFFLSQQENSLLCIFISARRNSKSISGFGIENVCRGKFGYTVDLLQLETLKLIYTRARSSTPLHSKQRLNNFFKCDFYSNQTSMTIVGRSTRHKRKILRFSTKVTKKNHSN